MTTLPAVVRIIDLPTGTTISGLEVVEAVQTVGGVQISVQLPVNQIVSTLGGLPTGGGTGQLVSKASATNFAATWSSVASFVSVNTASSLATSGTATAVIIGVASGGISSTQIANNAVGTNQLASSLGISSSLSVGTLLTVGGTATFNGTAIFNATTIFNSTTVFSGGLAVTGTSLLTGTFGVVGTALFTSGTFGVVGTSQFTGSFNVVGTALFTSGTFGVVGTTNITGAFNQVGTSLMTGSFGVSGTAAFTGALGLVGTTLFTSGAFGIVGTTLVTGRFGIVGTTLVTGFFSVVGTSQFTGTFGIAGTTIITGSLGLSSLTAGVLVASSTGVVSNQGGMVLLNTLSPNGVASTNDTSSFTSAYRTYMFVFDNIVPAVNTTTFQMQVATSGSNFITGSYVSNIQQNIVGGQWSTTVLLLSGTGNTASVGTSLLYGFNGLVYLNNPSGSVARKFINGLVSYAMASASSTGSLGAATLDGFFDGNSNPVTGVNFTFSSGNIATGVIKIYGMT